MLSGVRWQRDISEREIREAGAGAVIVEEYPEDKYGPTWLILGFTETGRPLHVQASVSESPKVRIVTLLLRYMNQVEMSGKITEGGGRSVRTHRL